MSAVPAFASVPRPGLPQCGGSPGFPTRWCNSRDGLPRGEPEGLRPPQLMDEGVDRFPPQFFAWGGQIDKVGIVGDCLTDRPPGQGCLELLCVLGGDVAGPPLIAVLGEDLQALAAGPAGPLDRLFVSPRNGHVSPEDGHQDTLDRKWELSIVRLHFRRRPP